MRRYLLFFAALGVIFGGWVWIAHRSNSSIPAPVNERPPYDPTYTYKMVAFYQSRVQRNPQNGAIEWGQLAGAYLQRCRETGDIADAQRAEAAAQRSLAIRARNNAPARDMLARSLFTQHEFVQAESLAQNTAARYPDDAEAQAGYAGAAIERGDYATAQRILQRLPDSQPGTPDPSCQALQARLLDINGQPAQALNLLRLAQTEADNNLDIPRENVAWFHMRVGDELARMGQADAAQKSYLEALSIYPHDYKTMTGLARLAAGRQDWPGTISWGQKAMQIVPAPEAVALVGDAYAASGNQAEAERQYRLIEAIGTLSRAKSIVYDRYRALFDANHGRHLAEGLSLAKHEMQVRQDVYAYDTLAWTSYKNGLLPQASAAMIHALAHGTQDALLFYHAGTIAKARGDRAQSEADFAHAAALDPYFQPAAPAVAQHPFGGF